MRPVTSATAVVLSGLSALHVAWGLGSTVPFADATTLADTVAGTDVMPGESESFGVAGLLALAAGLVSGAVPVPEPVRRVGVVGVAAVLGGRGVLGLTGRTGSIVAWEPSDRFVELDRRYYAPLCLALAGGALASARTA